MTTSWDYTDLAVAYLKRPDYSDAVIDAISKIACVSEGDSCCDIGAGVAHLTLKLASRNLQVTAIEPNHAMREGGSQRTANLSNVSWLDATAESTDQPSASFDLVTFGSSFNVCDRVLALAEVSRILKPSGWFSCLWNHRDLTDPIQADIEQIIMNRLPSYEYGTRRADQTHIIASSGLFGPVLKLSSSIVHKQSIPDCIEAWRSHATLQRQAGEKFYEVIQNISDYLNSLDVESIEIPYSTQAWIAQVR